MVHDRVNREVIDEERDEGDQAGDHDGLERERATLRKKGGHAAALSPFSDRAREIPPRS